MGTWVPKFLMAPSLRHHKGYDGESDELTVFREDAEVYFAVDAVDMPDIFSTTVTRHVNLHLAMLQ